MKKLSKKQRDLIKAYEEMAHEFADDNIQWTPFKLIDYFLAQLPSKSLVLDAGCGTGRDCVVFEKRGFDTIGIDLAGKLLEIARKSAKKSKFFVADIKETPFKENTFDGIWCHAVLLHMISIKDVEETLEEFYRILKAGGIAHLYTKTQIGKNKTETLKNSFYKSLRFFRYFKTDELRQLIRKTGFKIMHFKNMEECEIRTDGRKGVFWIHAIVKKN